MTTKAPTFGAALRQINEDLSHITEAKQEIQRIGAVVRTTKETTAKGTKFVGKMEELANEEVMELQRAIRSWQQEIDSRIKALELSLKEHGLEVQLRNADEYEYPEYCIVAL